MRAEAAGVGEILAGRELVRMALPIAHCRVVEGRISGHMGHRPALRDIAAGLADDDRKLAFVVEHFRHMRPHDRLAVGGQSVGEPGEDGGIFHFRALRFGAVGFVVDADAEDLRRVRDDREELHFILAEVGRPARRIGRGLRQEAGCDGGLEREDFGM